MAAEIKKQIGIDSELVRGSNGIFDVTVDGKRIFSKHDEGNFPNEKAIVEQIRKMKRSA